MGGGSSPEADRIGSVTGRGERRWSILPVWTSRWQRRMCVVTRDGAVMHQVKVPSTPADIAAALEQAPACRRVLFETGRMAPMLYHGQPAGITRRLRREPAGLSGAEVVSDAQDRPQRCPRPGASAVEWPVKRSLDARGNNWRNPSKDRYSARPRRRTNAAQPGPPSQRTPVLHPPIARERNRSLVRRGLLSSDEQTSRIAVVKAMHQFLDHAFGW